MSMIQNMEEKIEFLPDEEQETVEQPLKLVERTTPAETPPLPQPLTAEQGEEILQVIRALPMLAAQEIVEQTEPLRQRLGKATDHAFITKKAMEDLAALVKQLQFGTEESRTATAQIPAAVKSMRQEVTRSLRQSAAQMSVAVSNERVALRRDLSQIPTVRRYFGMCLLSVLLSSAISAVIFGLAWQQNKPDPMTIKAAETFNMLWERARAKERRQIEEIISRPIPRPQVQTQAQR